MSLPCWKESEWTALWNDVHHEKSPNAWDPGKQQIEKASSFLLCLKRLMLISHHFTQLPLRKSWKWHHSRGSTFLYHMHVAGIFPAGNTPPRQPQNLLPMHPHISRSALWSQTPGPSLIKYDVTLSATVTISVFYERQWWGCNVMSPKDK